MANTNIAPQGIFGPGILWVTRTDAGDPTPINVGYCNEFSTDMSFDHKELFGQNQFPLLVARSTAKATGKIKAAALSGRALNNMILGGTWTAGTQYDTITTVAKAIPATPFTITASTTETATTTLIPNSGTFNQDLGVVNSANGQAFTLVTTGTPTAGQYKVTAGAYLFASADNVSGISVYISYAYSYTTAAGQYQITANSLIGTTPTLQLDYKSILYGSTYYLRIFNAICTKWGMAHKLSDYAMPEYDFSFFQNAAGNISQLSVGSQAC